MQLLWPTSSEEIRKVAEWFASADAFMNGDDGKPLERVGGHVPSREDWAARAGAT